jgi:predicted anti-sigma-YlaC factor YlaD
MMTCEQAGGLIERRLDGEASLADDARLDAHLATCPSCALLLEQETTLDAALAARFHGAEPSPSLAAAVRTRVAAERPAPAAWIPDALNAAGLVLSLLVAVPLGAWWGGTVGVAVSLAAVSITCYPLLLGGLAGEFGEGEAGSGEPDPAA